MAEWAFVLYALEDGSPPLWHQRLRLGRLGCSVTEIAVVTPDGDVYFEDQDGESVDIAAVRRSPTRWPPPIGVPRGATYRFATDPTPAEIVRWQAEAEVMAKTEHRDRGARLVGGVGLLPLERLDGGGRPGDGGAAEVVLPQGGKTPLAGEINVDEWFVCEDVEVPSWSNKCVGVVAPSAVLVVSSAGRGVWRLPDGREFFAALASAGVKRGGGEILDARVLPVVRGRGGRWRDWMQAAESMQEEDVKEFVLMPRSAGWCVDWLKRAGGPTLHHENWRTRRRLGQFDFGVQEHLALCTILEDLACWDQVDLTNLLGVERAFRRLQMIEHHYDERQRDKHDEGRMPPEEVDAFMGGPLGGRPVSMVCPQVLDDIAKQLERVAGIKKNARKLREETKPNQPPKKGGGKDEK